MPYQWSGLKGLLDTPHLLIAGTTGSGKSVFLNSLIYTAISDAPGFIFIDLKRVELRRYKRLVTTVAYAEEPEQVNRALDKAIAMMESRYKKAHGRETSDPPVYIIIDELADVVYSCPKSTLERIVKIGRLGRAAKIHLICATQDPSKKTLSAQLMQNFTTRIALRCFSPIESRQIIGVAGAETLPQYGFGLRRDSTGVSRMSIPCTPDADIDSLVRELSGIRYWLHAFGLLKCPD